MDVDIPGILSTLRSESDPQVSALFYTFEDLYQRKLWHQLTNVLDEYYKAPASRGIRMRLFKNFVSEFKYKINQLKLVEFLLSSLAELDDAAESQRYLTELKEHMQKQENLDKEQALLFIDIEVARCKIQLKQETEARDDLDKIDKSLARIDSADLKLNQSYFSTNAEYYKVKSDYNNFYYQSLLYLSTTQLEDIPLLQQKTFAYELSISALLANKIYNFGELLTHPILKTLEGGEYQWIIDLLHSLNSGDIDAFSKNLSHLEKVPLLRAQESFLKQKICLMTLVELVFSKSIRIISFKDVSKSTHLSIDDVEHLVMRALSLGLLKGSIDQISQTIAINWVQPRIINQTQISNMKEKLVSWDANVSKLGKFMEQNGKEIWIE